MLKFKISLLRGSVGHAITNTSIYFGLEKPNYRTIIFYSEKICDNEPSLKILISNLRKNFKITLIKNRILYSILYRLVHMGLFDYNPFKSIYGNLLYAHHDKDSIKYGNHIKVWYPGTLQPECTITKEQEDYFESWREKFGITKKYVCIFSRDDGYHHDDKHSKFRNSNFTDLIPTIKYLKGKDYQIIRVGRGHLEDEFDNSDLYLDYNKIKSADKLIDVLLLKYCDFYIGSNSGIIAIPFMFNKRILIHNMFPAGIRLPYKNGVYILKKYKKNGKTIPYNKIPKDLMLTEDQENLQKRGFDVESNTANEIKSFVRSQVDSNFQNVISPPKNSYIYGTDCELDAPWFERNNNLF